MQSTVLRLDQQITALKLKLKVSLGSNSNNIALFFLGLTGSGKSSIISYLLGANVQFVKKGLTYVLSHNQGGIYPVIGNTNESCTDIPSLFVSEGQTFYDPPGFLDTKGVHQEILNSYSNAKMFQRGNKAKIILVVELATLQSARGGDLPRVAKRLKQLFDQDFIQIIQSCALIITKVNTTEVETQDVFDVIEGIVQSNKNLIPECQMLLKTILANKRVLLFPLPTQINQSTISNIKNSLKSIVPFVIINDAVISNSAQAETEIQNLSHKLGDQINSAANAIAIEIKKKFNGEIQNKQAVEEKLLKVKAVKTMLLSGELSSGKVQSLQEFAALVELKKQDTDHLKGLFDQLEFCRTLFHRVKVMNNIEEIILIAIENSEGILNTMFEKLASKEEIQKMEKKNEENMIKKEQELKEERRIAEEKNDKREALMRKEFKEQQTAFQQMMKEQNEQYREDMSRLNSQLLEIASRPPQIIEKESGGCEIM